MIEFVPGGLINVFGSLLISVIGAAILLVRPRTKRNVSYALHFIAFGISFAVDNFGFPGQPGLNATRGALSAVMMALTGLVLLPVMFDAMGKRRQDRIVGWAVVAGMVVLNLPAVMWTLQNRTIVNSQVAASLDIYPSAFVFITLSAYAIVVSVVFATVLMYTRQASRRAVDPTSFGQYAILSAALVFFHAFTGGAYLLSDQKQHLLQVMALVPPTFVLVAWWLAMSARDVRPRLARNIGLGLLMAMLVGMVFTVLGLLGLGGPIRVISAALVAFSIVRYHVLDIEVKVKWGLKQSTVASIFIAVFFIVSEGAQELFGAAADNQWWGIVAAAGLVFFIAPLQRLAEKVAEQALPGVKPLDMRDSAEKLELYLQQVQMAWRDGLISRDERLFLDRLREQLGISDTQAAQLERQAIAR